MGDLSELIASIAEKGIIEPLVVRQRGGRYQIIAGERRYHASVQAGLREVPVVIRESDDIEVMELALVENLQRKDLTAFEEAEALLQLCETCSYTHEDLAQKLGKSRTSITESLSLAAMPEEVRNLCRLADITAKSTLLQIVRQGDPKKMLALVEKVAQGGTTTRKDLRDETAKGKPGRPKAFVFAFQPADQGVQPASQLHQVARRQVRDHRSARRHHPRAQGPAPLGARALGAAVSTGRHQTWKPRPGSRGLAARERSAQGRRSSGQRKSGTRAGPKRPCLSGC